MNGCRSTLLIFSRYKYMCAHVFLQHIMILTVLHIISGVFSVEFNFIESKIIFHFLLQSVDSVFKEHGINRDRQTQDQIVKSHHDKGCRPIVVTSLRFCPVCFPFFPQIFSCCFLCFFHLITENESRQNCPKIKCLFFPWKVFKLPSKQRPTICPVNKVFGSQGPKCWWLDSCLSHCLVSTLFTYVPIMYEGGF